MITLIQRAFEKFCWALLHCYCRLRVYPEKRPRGSYIFCANHASHLDTPILMTALGRDFRSFKILAAKDYFSGEGKRKTVSQYLFNLVLVDRQAPPMETRRLLKECLAAKASGDSLIIYPEGSRTTDGSLQELKSGSVYLAQKIGLPIVPVAIIGSDKAMPKNSYFVYPKKITVRFGSPIQPKPFARQGQKKDLQELTKALRDAIQTLLETPEA